MTPRSSVVQFSNAVVRAEVANGGTRSGVAERIVARLRTGLVKLIGPAGFDVLLARSLVLARRNHPGLAGVTVGSDGALAGFDDPARDAAAQQELATAIVSHFLDLLVILVGEDLGMRLVRDLWPGGVDGDEKGPA